MSVWLLTNGEYSAYHVVGAFPDEASAKAFYDELAAKAGDYDDLAVEEIETLDDLTVYEYDNYERRCAVRWDGTVSDERPESLMHHVYVAAEAPTYAPIDVRVWPEMAPGVESEADRFKIGTLLWVVGTDVERCRKAYNEQIAQILSDPATSAVRAWSGAQRRYGDERQVREYLDAPSNVGIRAAVLKARDRL